MIADAKLHSVRELRTRMYRLVLRPDWLEVRFIYDETNGSGGAKPLAVIEGAETARRIFAAVYREALTNRGDAFVAGLVAGVDSCRRT
jgi:hypothetical protein